MSLAPSRFKKWGKDADDFAAFPILAALSRRPLTSIELSQLLLSHAGSVRRQCEKLESLGWIIKRADDNRWVMVVRLMAVGIPQPDGVPGVTLTTGKPIGPGPVTSHVVLEPSGEAQEGPDEPEAVGPSPMVRAGQPGAGRANPELVAGHFDVPLELEGEGCWAGPLAPCMWCGERTPLKYGKRVICPPCARKESTL